MVDRVGLSPLNQSLKDIYMPRRGNAPTAGAGLQNLAPSSVDPLVGLRRITEEWGLETNRLLAETEAKQQRPTIEYGPQLGYSPSTGKIGVNGFVFDKKDYASALESEQYRTGPAQPLPRDQITDWVPLSDNAYSALIASIKNPSTGERFSRGFEYGVEGSKQLAGAGLQFLGFEDVGSNIVAGTQERMTQLAPFEKQFTDIRDIGDVGEWFVFNAGQVSPSIIEAVVTAGGGAAVAKLGAKAFLKKEVKEAFAKDVAAYQAAKKAGNKAVMDQLESRVRKGAAMQGALYATALNNLRTGTSDVYNELREKGVDANDLDARLASLVSGTGYAALESLPEFALALRFLKPPELARGASMAFGDKARRVAGRVGKGALVGGALEGATEAGQEAILMGTGALVAGADYSDEFVNRFWNSFAAGAAIGAPFGGLAGASATKPVDLLQLPAPAPAPEVTQPVSTSLPDTMSNEEVAAAITQLDDTLASGSITQEQYDEYRKAIEARVVPSPAVEPAAKPKGKGKKGKGAAAAAAPPVVPEPVVPEPVAPTQLDLAQPAPAAEPQPVEPTAGLIVPPQAPAAPPRISPTLAEPTPVFFTASPESQQYEMFQPSLLGQAPVAPIAAESQTPFTYQPRQTEMFSYQQSYQGPFTEPMGAYRVSPEVLRYRDARPAPPPAAEKLKAKGKAAAAAKAKAAKAAAAKVAPAKAAPAKAAPVQAAPVQAAPVQAAPAKPKAKAKKPERLFSYENFVEIPLRQMEAAEAAKAAAAKETAAKTEAPVEATVEAAAKSFNDAKAAERRSAVIQDFMVNQGATSSVVAKAFSNKPNKKQATEALRQSMMAAYPDLESNKITDTDEFLKKTMEFLRTQFPVSNVDFDFDKATQGVNIDNLPAVQGKKKKVPAREALDELKKELDQVRSVIKCLGDH